MIQVPDTCLGWEIGETRIYQFWGCKVEAFCKREDAVECYLYLPGQTVPFADSPYMDPTYQDIENEVQEWAAETVLKGLKKGMLSLVEVGA